MERNLFVNNLIKDAAYMGVDNSSGATNATEAAEIKLRSHSADQ